MKYIIFLLFLIPGITLQAQSIFEEESQAPEASYADDITINLRSAAYVNSKSKDALYFQSLYSQFGLEGQKKFSGFGTAYGSLRFRYGNEFSEELRSVELREAYTSIYAGPAELKVGKQILSLGNTSFLNPTDQLSPRDPTYRSPEANDLRIGSWMAQLKLSISSGSSLEFLYLPFFTPSNLLTEPFDFPDYLEIDKNYTNDMLFKNSGFGFLYDYRGAIFDLQLSFLHAYKSDPLLLADTLVFNTTTFEAEKIKIITEPVLVNAAGLNLSVPLGSYMFRTEAAWLDPVEGSKKSFPYSELSYAAELEQLGENVSVLAGYYGKYIPEFTEDNGTLFMLDMPDDLTSLFPEGVTPDYAMIMNTFSEQTTRFNRLYMYQDKKVYHAVYAIASISMLNDRLEFEIPGMYQISTGELSLMPSLRFKLTDGLKIQAGAFFLEGKDESLNELTGPSLNAIYLLLDAQF